MVNWVLKAVVQSAASQLPRSSNINFLFQKYITHSLPPTKKSLIRRAEWTVKHIQFYQQFSGQPGLPANALELGTGWVPTVPLILHLSGIDTVYTIDIHDLKYDSIINVLLNILFDFSVDELQALLPTFQPERFTRLQAQWKSDQSPAKLFESANIRFLITDARSTDFSDGTIPFFVSNTTFEHIPGEVLGDILKEYRRIATPGAIMSHLIDMSDHYSHSDPSISVYHFLQHEPNMWRLVNNSLLYQNRLRVSDYRVLHVAAGFSIVHEQNQLAHAERLKEIKLAKQFQAYSTEDLIPSSSWMISKPI